MCPPVLHAVLCHSLPLAGRGSPSPATPTRSATTACGGRLTGRRPTRASAPSRRSGGGTSPTSTSTRATWSCAAPASTSAGARERVKCVSVVRWACHAQGVRQVHSHCVCVFVTCVTCVLCVLKGLPTCGVAVQRLAADRAGSQMRATPCARHRARYTVRATPALHTIASTPALPPVLLLLTVWVCSWCHKCQDLGHGNSLPGGGGRSCAWRPCLVALVVMPVRQQNDDESGAPDTAAVNRPVYLNVGGQRFMTCVHTSLHALRTRVSVRVPACALRVACVPSPLFM